MNKLFDLNSPFMRVLSRMADLVFVSILWVICCIPIITIGPATAAMYHVTLKLARKEDVHVISCFFQGFKNNFKQGVILNIIFLVVGTVIFLDYFIMSNAEGTAGMLTSTCFFVMGIWLLCIMFYAYPLQAQFYNPIRRTLKNAAILSMQKFRNTVIVFLLNMLPVILLLVSVDTMKFVILTAPFWVALAPGLGAFLCAKRFVKLFDPYVNPDKETESADAEEEIV